jgi:hypothetical protein
MPITVGKSVTSIFIGVAMIVGGLTAKQFYGGASRFRDTRPVPRWQGRALFLVIGGVFLVFGVSYLIIDLWGQ